MIAHPHSCTAEQMGWIEMLKDSVSMQCVKKKNIICAQVKIYTCMETIKCVTIKTKCFVLNSKTNIV